MKKKSNLIVAILSLMAVLLCACGGIKENVDFSEYRGGAKLENLLDENTYKKNGEKT